MEFKHLTNITKYLLSIKEPCKILDSRNMRINQYYFMIENYAVHSPP